MSSSPMTTAETMDVTRRFSSHAFALDSVRHLPRVWRRRAVQRRQLRMLETWQLDDLGLTPADADLEGRKLFWQA